MITIVKKRPDRKFEDIFDMEQIQKYFSDQEIKNLKILINSETVNIDGDILNRCPDCGTLVKSKFYKNKCAKCIKKRW
jgi:hypothetical protein